MKQAKLFGEEEPIVLTKLELAKAQILAKQVESIVKPCSVDPQVRFQSSVCGEA